MSHLRSIVVHGLELRLPLVHPVPKYSAAITNTCIHVYGKQHPASCGGYIAHWVLYSCAHLRFSMSSA